LARAESVKRYLVDKWSIDPSRLHIGHRLFDPTGLSPEAYQEGNHVSITTDSLPIIEPLRLTTITRALNVPKLRIKTSYDSRYPLALYSVSLMQGDRVLAQFNNAPAQSDTGVHTWAPTETQLPSTDEPLTISLNLRDSVGTMFNTADTARIEQLTIKKKREERIEDTIIERYNLVTFELDKADLDERGQSIIQEIGKHIAVGDKVRLRGYTDLLGDPAHNFALSESRAQAVKNALFAAIGPELSQTITLDASGLGRANLVDNRLPEGRFLSRTVQVLIERPVK
jgi:outer membrane protein OmpA-like peptidoglycan-associated protein